MALAPPYFHLNQTALLTSSAGSTSLLHRNTSGQELVNYSEAELAGTPTGLLLDSPPPVPPASRKTKFDKASEKRTRSRNQKKETTGLKGEGKEKGKVADKTKSSSKGPSYKSDKSSGAAKTLMNEERQVYQQNE